MDDLSRGVHAFVCCIEEVFFPFSFPISILLWCVIRRLIGDPLTPGLSSQYTQAVCLKHVCHLSFMYNGSGQAKCFVCLRDISMDSNATPMNRSIIADYYTLHDMYFMICRRRQIWMIDSWCWRCQHRIFLNRKKHTFSKWILWTSSCTKASEMDSPFWVQCTPFFCSTFTWWWLLFPILCGHWVNFTVFLHVELVNSVGELNL